MKIKTIIRLVDCSNLSALFGAAFLGILFINKTGRTWFYPVETLLALCCLSLFLFRMILLPWALKHSEEPEILYAVLEKLNMTYILFSNFSPTEGYRPAHLTSQFLTDNQLVTEIGPGRPWPTANSKPLLVFTDKGLQYDQWQLSWKDICDWKYYAKSEGDIDKISDEMMIIKYYGPQQTIEETRIKLRGLYIHRVDFLLLLLYFKTKHG
jgi:hypothetical protein